MAKPEPAKIVSYWLSEIKSAKKREDRYREMGREVLELYDASAEQETPFNILYSNTETLRPALFSAQPRPVVSRRFQDTDPLGKSAADAGRRILDFHLDTNREGYETVMEAMANVVLDALLPGRGMACVKYDADFIPLTEPRPPDESDSTPPTTEPAEYAENEQVCVESVIWDRIYIGYAKKWHQVPWVAYEFYLTKEAVAKKFGRAVSTELTYTATQDSSDEGHGRRAKEEVGERRVARLYQIWDKVGGKKVRYVAEGYTERELLVEDDPLGLTGFFNTPRPLMFVEKSCSLIPTAPYKMYKSQADELNRITQRIKRLTEAIKARGFYDKALGADLGTLMQKNDNALVPAEVSSSLATEKGFQNAIWFLPLDVLMAVLQQLYQAREACKQTIYEITGIADIMRGATNASETLGAQQIKNSWGTLRLKRIQMEVARYVRDLLRMMLELAASKLSEETWAAMTGLPFVATAQRQQLDQQAAVLTQMQQPRPPELDAQLAQPVWGQVLALLRNDLARSYRIDIETNSTIQPEAAEDQEAITKILQALGQTMQSFGPLVMQGVLPFKAAQDLLLFIARRYRYGDDLEESIQAMQPPQPPDNGQAQDAELRRKTMELEQQHNRKELDFQQKESAMTLKAQAMQQEFDHAKHEMDLSVREAELKMEEQQFRMQQNMEKGMLDMHTQRASEEIGTKQTLQQMQEKKYNVEAVVNKKTDTALQSVTQAVRQVQALGQALQAVQQQAEETKTLLERLIHMTSAKRVKKPIRGTDGRIVRVEEEIEPTPEKNRS